MTSIRRQEMEQMKQLIQTDECYSRYIVSCLDDKTAADCGHCSNCTRKELFPSEISASTIHVAEAYINKLILPIEPRKQWAYSSVTQQKRIAHVNQSGFCISKYGDAGYGELVKQGKYSKEKRFCDLVFGLLDCSIAMFFFLPFFGQKADAIIQEVSLLSLTEIAPYLRTAYFVVVIGIIGSGMVTLALQNCYQAFWVKNKSKISLALNAVGTLLFIISSQPYAAAFLFIFLVIKVLMLVKWQ